VPWDNKQLASSDFTFRKRKKGRWCEIWQIVELGEHINVFFTAIIENRGSDGFWGNGLAKNKLCTDMLVLFSPKTTLNLCYDLKKVSCSNCFALEEIVQQRQWCLI
jgi:hypothetical protein